jgi:hypothetical protein
MAYHPLNLAFRFVLELAALAAMASYGWHLTEHTAPRLVAAIGLPLLAAAMWGVFAVPGDRSRSGKAPVAVPGWVRLTWSSSSSDSRSGASTRRGRAR